MLFLDFFILLLVPQVLSQDAIEPRIVGGQETTIEDYPYQLSMTIRTVSLQGFCGAFIVSQNYILTAAHCLYGFVTSTENIEVRGGSTFRNEGTVIPISEFRVHPDYATNQTSPNDKDIGCLRTSSPIQFSDIMQPIGLPPVNRTLTGVVTVTGWGRTQNNSTQLPRTLMAVEIPVVNRTLCENVYKEDFTSNMWCGGDYETGGISPCQGDSGGPAVQDGMAVGIVSFGMTCGGVGQPAVFVDLAAQPVRDFISDCIGL